MVAVDQLRFDFYRADPAWVAAHEAYQRDKRPGESASAAFIRRVTAITRMAVIEEAA